MIKHEKSLEEWMNSMTDERRGYMKKPKGRALWVFWWEPEEPGEEYWFCNVERRKNLKEEVSSVWVTRKDLPTHLASYLRESYELFLDE